MTDRIQSLRLARGWTQAELAKQAGVTRQLVSALEAGRHTPNVTAALGLARALDTSVEELFAPHEESPVDVFGANLPAGTPVSMARVGDRLVTVADAHGLGGAEEWRVADAVAAQEVTWLPGGRPADVLIAGCDPAMGLLTGLVERAGHRMLGVHASTGRAVEALGAGRVHGVLVHGPAGDLPEPPVDVRRWRVASWSVGLGSSRRAMPSVEELAEGRARVVQRDAGAGSQKALVRALRQVGADGSLPGPIGDGHIDVARRVSYGGVAAGVLMEAAAAAFDLRFTALEEHHVELWIADEWSGLPAVAALLEILTGPALGERLRLLPGYDASSCGTELRAV